jgi:hypothetical protein
MCFKGSGVGRLAEVGYPEPQSRLDYDQSVVGCDGVDRCGSVRRQLYKAACRSVYLPGTPKVPVKHGGGS